MDIMIGTPMFASQCGMYFNNTIIRFVSGMSAKGHRIEFMDIGNESLIQRARNNLTAMFWSHPIKFDHLIWWDADVSLAPEHLERLLLNGKDVTGAPIRLKDKFKKRFSVTPMYDKDGKPIKEGTLFRAYYMATGLMVLSRKAVGDLIEIAKKNDDIYTNKHNTMKVENSKFIYDAFQVGINDKSLPYSERNYLSEDYDICKKLTDLGYEIWVDESIPTSHQGVMNFDSTDICPDEYEAIIANLKAEIEKLKTGVSKLEVRNVL
jgi:hypothetical protein